MRVTTIKLVFYQTTHSKMYQLALNQLQKFPQGNNFTRHIKCTGTAKKWNEAKKLKCKSYKDSCFTLILEMDFYFKLLLKPNFIYNDKKNSIGKFL